MVIIALRAETVKRLKKGTLIQLSFPPNSSEIGVLDPNRVYSFEKISEDNTYLILEGHNQLCPIRWFSLYKKV